MSAPNEDAITSHSELPSHVFNELLDSIMIDVASECHRIAKLGLDRNLDEVEEEVHLSAQACAMASDPSNSSEASSKFVVDIYGQTHPPVADEVFDCMNCGRSVMAGRFAPHLEKCMGKGRKARPKATRSSTAARNRHTQGSPVSAHSSYFNSTSTDPASHASSGIAGNVYTNGTREEP
ncbi:unnamed protein product [Cuscuta campestris]|uniref:SAGA-associated factor 11 n=1 Tax=Cuscuta campestris TaxID=132261 RepID=A0A484L633_9ASTE|nr:unnamed protein product [Cuscuta campestris]